MRVHHFDAVMVQMRPGQLRNITNTRQIAELLTGPWPAKRRGVPYAAVVKACMDHHEGRTSADDVRKAFITAAKDADIFVREGLFLG